MGEKVDDILRLLGADAARNRHPVLLPVEAKSKGPRIAGWNQMSVTDMARPDYIAQLEAHPNTGVLLGEPSGGLCTLDFDREEFVEPFLEVNPRLRRALRTKGQKGCQIWCWLDRDPRLEQLGLHWYPEARFNVNHRDQQIEAPGPDGKPLKTPVVALEWRGGGGHQSIVWGVHPQGMDYKVLVSDPPLGIRFRDICWPPWCARPWELQWFAALQQRFGPAFVRTGDHSVMLTDHFWAGRFRLLNDLIWEPEEKTFYGYNGQNGAWQLRTLSQVRNLISLDVLDYAREAGMPILETNIGRSLGRMNAIVGFLEGEVTQWKAFQRPPGIVHLANGVIDLNEATPELKPFSPDFMSRNRVPWNYDPAATCPRFIAELLEPALPSADIYLLQLCFGAALLGQNLMQRIVILTGQAGGGKSTLVDVLQQLVGEHNAANLRTHLLDERFELEGYIGKNLLTAADVRGDFLQKPSAANLKGLTGGDHLEAELKGGKRIKIRGVFNVWITCNSRLKVRMEGDADAWRRRLIIINYERPKPTRVIPNFAALLLKEEASGILNWGLQGARDLLEQARVTGRIFMTDAQLERVDKLLAESESVAHFVEQCVERTDKVMKQSLTTEELLHAYREFCATMKWHAVPDSAFLNRCTDVMLQFHAVSMSNDLKRERDGVQKTKRGWRHVQLRMEVADEG